jgi:hypothetical protein
MYMQQRAPPTPQDMANFQGMQGTYDWTDILRWCEEVGLAQGVLYDEDTGAVEFLEFPLESHEALIFEFNTRFSMQFLLPWVSTPFHPVFEGLGSSSKASQHHFVSKANVVDFWYPGRKKSPDASFRPYPRPNPAMLNAALVRLQPLFAKPWPTIHLEVGNSQRVPDIITIRNNVLGHQTQVNAFFAVVYNRNSTPARDSWWACLAHRDTNAPPPSLNSPATYPGNTVVGELQKVNGKYMKINDPLPANTVWRVSTNLLFHPQPIPVLVPPLPPTLDIDLEIYRQTILRTS